MKNKLNLLLLHLTHNSRYKAVHRVVNTALFAAILATLILK